jgi:tetratricopeptide (TPR) repeat protein
MLRCLGRNDEALASYEKAATTSKNPIVRQDARQGRAEILFQQGKHNEVITACTKSIELSPKDPRPWYRRAAARALMGDTANALSDLKKVFYLNPDLKKRAAKDAAFKSLCDTEKFKNLRPEAPPEDGFKLSAEWKALNRLVGDWEGQETVTVPETKQGRGLRTAKWTLGDRYLEMKWKSGLDNTDGMSLTTYDPDQQAIRCWAFSSRYAPAVLSARWDEQTKTLTYNGEDAGPITFVATDRFLDDDHREWACTIKDASGKILFASTAKITRQKK